MGMWSSSVGLHIDEHDLISLNYLHHGSPKLWYIIHPSCYSKLEELVNKLKLFSDISSSCLSPLQHKSLLLKPSFLHAYSIEFYQIEQKLNELVVIFPGIYHFYFDTGFNLSETTKYALPSWLQFQQRSPRLCSCSIPSFLTSSLNRRYFSTDIVNKFQEEYLSSTISSCVELSSDDDNGAANHSTTESTTLSASSAESNHNNNNNIQIGSVELVTSPKDPLFHQYIDPVYLSSSSMYSNISTPASPTPIINHSNVHESTSNILDNTLSRTHVDIIQRNDHSSYFQPCKTYSSVVWSLTPSVYPSCCTTYPYPFIRTYTNKRHLKRRKCYGCRQRGHLRKECPYLIRQ